MWSGADSLRFPKHISLYYIYLRKLKQFRTFALCKLIFTPSVNFKQYLKRTLWRVRAWQSQGFSTLCFTQSWVVFLPRKLGWPTRSLPTLGVCSLLSETMMTERATKCKLIACVWHRGCDRGQEQTNARLKCKIALVAQFTWVSRKEFLQYFFLIYKRFHPLFIFQRECLLARFTRPTMNNNCLLYINFSLTI